MYKLIFFYLLCWGHNKFIKIYIQSVMAQLFIVVMMVVCLLELMLLMAVIVFNLVNRGIVGTIGIQEMYK